MLRDAIPPLNATVPSEAAPSRNCTLPVAAAGETTALNVTAVPESEGFAEEPIATVVAAFATVTVVAAEVLPA